MVEVVEKIELRSSQSEGQAQGVSTETPQVRESPAELDELGQVLLKARDIIRANGWCQNAYMDYDDPDDWLEMKKQPKVCLVGALNVAFGGSSPDDDDSRRDLPFLYIRERMGLLGVRSIIDWNDTTDRTQQEVEERLERAAYNL